MNIDDLSTSKPVWPLPPAELQHRVRQAIASLRLEGFTVPGHVYEQVLDSLRNTSAVEINATIAEAIAFVQATQ